MVVEIFTSWYNFSYSVNDDLTTVKLVDKDTGIRATGNALCDTLDEFDPDFGLSLAYARAAERLFKKIARVYARGK